MRRGLDFALAGEVATKLMEHDALEAHARDELGISHINKARPLQAAMASAASFSVGALLPLIVAALASAEQAISAIAVTALVALALLGCLAARAGGAKMLPAVMRVTFWSAMAMAVTSGVGVLFGT